MPTKAVAFLPHILQSVDYRSSQNLSDRYPVTWQMNQSTIIMPCNTSGYYRPDVAAQYGLVDIDWSNEKNDWANAPSITNAN